MRIPWKKICGLLEALETERTPDALLLRAAEEVQHLVPAAHTLVIRMRDRAFRSPRFFRSLDAPSGFWEQYMEYYNRLDPHYSQPVFDTIPAVSRESILAGREDEFKRDFLRPHDTGHLVQMSDVSAVPGEEFFLCLYRGRRSPFTPGELTIAEVLQPHLHALFQGAAAAVTVGAEAPGLPADLSGLSRREQEIAALLRQRLSTAEIADRLFISPRTVSKHLEHIYLKLNVHRRTDVSRALLKGSRSTGADALWRFSLAQG